jgi:thiamine biosynthesis protein ThiI
MGLILVRYGEIALKGKNRPYFIRRLRKNIKDCLQKNGLSGDIRTIGHRLYVHTDDVERAADKLRDVFGIVSLSPAVEVPADIKALKQEALRVARAVGLNERRSFHTDARRADKTFPLTSPEINRVVGGHVQAATGARVDLSEGADLIIGIEVRRGHALVFEQKVIGHGGLPLGTEGRAVALMSGGIDSPVAAWLIMKRGCGVIPLHFRQGEVECGKFLDNCEVLSRYAYGWDIRPIVVEHDEVFGELWEKLQRIRAERWACIFCKRALLQRACQIADEHKAKALVMGDSLGQVASQTLDNLEVISYGIPKPILRPLIGLDKVEITALGRRIGTFEISTREARACPYLPPNPITKASLPRLKEIIERMEALD